VFQHVSSIFFNCRTQTQFIPISEARKFAEHIIPTSSLPQKNPDLIETPPIPKHKTRKHNSRLTTQRSGGARSGKAKKSVVGLKPRNPEKPRKPKNH
jgi:hypothetical protein